MKGKASDVRIVGLLKPHYVNLYCICTYVHRLLYCIVYFVHMHACTYVRMYVFHSPQPEDTQQLVRMASLIGDIKQHELSYLKMLQQLMVCVEHTLAAF